MREPASGGVAIGLAAVVGGVILLVVLVGAASSAILGGSSQGSGACGPASATVTASTGLDPEQRANATTIVGVAAQLRLPERAAVIAIATVLQESGLHDLDHGDRDSLGLFQQRPSQGWGTPAQILNPVYAATAFYTRLIAIPGWQTLPLSVAAQNVQRSGAPGAYSRWETLANSVVASLSGGSCAGSSLTGPATQGQIAARWALTQLGKPYEWGAAGPDSYDCSGLVMVAWKYAGIQLGRTTYVQWTEGSLVARDQLQPGDLVFFEPTPAGPGHVGIYIGNGQYVNAPEPGQAVRVDNLSEPWSTAEYAGARRPG